MPVDAGGRVASRHTAGDGGGHEGARECLASVVRGGVAGDHHAIDDKPGSDGIWTHVNAGRIVISNDDILAERGCGYLAARGSHKRTEAGEYLYKCLSRIV